MQARHNVKDEACAKHLDTVLTVGIKVCLAGTFVHTNACFTLPVNRSYEASQVLCPGGPFPCRELSSEHRCYE